MASESSKGYLLSEDAVQQLNHIRQLIREEVHSLEDKNDYGRDSWNRQVRVAQVTEKKEDAFQFEVKFGTPDFDNESAPSNGGDKPDFEVYEGQEAIIASTLVETTLEKDDLVYVRLCHGQWYIITIADPKPGETRIFKTGEDGIPARNDDEPCPELGMADDVKWWELEGEEGSPVKMCEKGDFTVYNPFQSDIEGDTYIIASKIKDKWVVHAEDCPDA